MKKRNRKGRERRRLTDRDMKKKNRIERERKLPRGRKGRERCARKGEIRGGKALQTGGKDREGGNEGTWKGKHWQLSVKRGGGKTWLDGSESTG